tara:strand:- start:206 stop:1168 length:963 start_codon:yes stop_codon:yes gene_type:complete
MKYESKDAASHHKKLKFIYDITQEYYNKFIDPKTGKFDEKYTQLRSCPVCESKIYINLFQCSGGEYVKCNECTLVYLNPVFTKEALEKFNRERHGGHAEAEIQSDFLSEIYNLGLDDIEKKCLGKNILDIGCSTGVFLDFASKRKWITTGIELGNKDSEIAKSKGHEIHNSELDKLEFKERFDAITLWDVFEHIPDGKEYLKLIHNNLKENGFLFLQVPSSDSLAAKIMREKCRAFDGIEHVNMFNPKTLTMILEDSGFEIKGMTSVISEIAVLNNFLSYEDPYYGESSFGEDLCDSINADLIHKNFLGYKIQCIAKKII